MRRPILAIVLAAIAPFAWPAARAMASDAEIEKMITEISAARIEARIRKLVAFETRNSLSDTQSETKGIGAARKRLSSRHPIPQPPREAPCAAPFWPSSSLP
ncbi:MAG TPA: hypothetical protein VFV17_04710, partial [Usitatibacteraceae bacterium]|nr:hypothetical protein [Usitatibacteraceae bacterium]